MIRMNGFLIDDRRNGGLTDKDLLIFSGRINYQGWLIVAVYFI